MTQSIQGKLASIVAEIDRAGHANQTRLTSLKKWFAHSGRLQSFGLWVAAAVVAEPADGQDGDPGLLETVHGLLADWTLASSAPDRVLLKVIHGRLRAFQDQHREMRWGQAREIRSRKLWLIERGLELYLYMPDCPSAGYKLAADLCLSYDPQYGTDLNGPSRDWLLELMRFVDEVEAHEDAHRDRAVIAA